MNFLTFFNHIQQRRALNQWLKEQRRGRFEVDGLSDHIKRDIGLYQQDVKAPLKWREAKARQQQPELQEQAHRHKERAGPSSA